MSHDGIIFDIKRYSINDGPGIRTTVFFQGCPLNCLWCHNPESRPGKPVLLYRANRCVLCGDCVKACPSNAISINGSLKTERSQCSVCGECAEACYRGAREISGRRQSTGEIMGILLRDTPFYEQSGGGVTFSGGEPLLQPEFLFELLELCKQAGVHTTVDTSGFADWSVFSQILQHVDLFLYDFKLFDNEKHIRYAGAANGLIKDNLKRLSEQGRPIRIRIPLIPGINDDELNLKNSAQFISQLKNIEGVELLGYHDIAASKYRSLDLQYALKDLKPPSKTHLDACRNTLREYLPDVQLL